MVQFIKAMRDERGEMVRNAHLLGFFRRICKLLFLRTKPVFVFDGATPSLKRRTLIARRRQRENAQAKVRKTAEKLLLNHVSLVSCPFRVFLEFCAGNLSIRLQKLLCLCLELFSSRIKKFLFFNGWRLLRRKYFKLIYIILQSKINWNLVSHCLSY